MSMPTHLGNSSPPRLSCDAVAIVRVARGCAAHGSSLARPIAESRESRMSIDA